MAGLKVTQLADAPVSFWTFDSDRIGLNGGMIVDEIGNQNPMVLHDDMRGSNYWLEQLSLNTVEPADQYAITFAKDQKVGNDWLQQYGEVTHSGAYEFPTRGQFSVEWLMYKVQPDVIRNSGEPGYYHNIETPILSKGNTINVKYIDTLYGGSTDDYIEVEVVGRTVRCVNEDYPIYDKHLHCVVTYTVDQTDVNEYTSTIRFFVNGRLIASDIEAHVDTFPVTNTGVSWLFAGNGGGDPVTDFATERLTLDQIAVYDYPLTFQQVSNHYRKTTTYNEMIKNDYPVHYWSLDEIEDPLDFTVYSELNDGVNGEYKGVFTRDQDGPTELIGSRSPYIGDGGGIYFEELTHSSAYKPMIDISSEYTLEFWFKVSSDTRGLLFDCTEEVPPDYHGLRVYINSKANLYSNGHIQISESKGNSLVSRDIDENGEAYYFNDDTWHHIAVRRKDNILTLTLDGVEHARGGFDPVDISKPGQIHLMNGRPGDFQVKGNISELAYYDFALQDHQIYNRWRYSTRYKIAGYTLLQGAPVQAEVRFYDSITGVLVNKVNSNPVTGEYEFYPLSNRHLDIMSKLPENNTTRYRVHGPVAPAEYDDSHLQ